MMKHRRKLRSLRFKDFDYSYPGGYFVTICTRDRINMFGVIEKGIMVKNTAGIIVQKCWDDLPIHYNCTLGEFVVMPNHVHGIIMISDTIDRPGDPNPVGAGLKPAPTVGLSEIVRALKTFSARRINERDRSPGRKVWQRGFYDRIIRNEQEFDNISQYIFLNPRKWEEDRNNPYNTKEKS